MKKITLGQLFHGCWFVFFCLLYFSICHYIRYFLVCFALGLVLFVLLIFLCTKYKSVIQALASKPVSYIVMGILMLTGMLIAGRAMLVKPFNDSGTIWFSVVEIIESGSVSNEINQYASCSWSTHTSNHDYFLIYPNSRFMVSFLLPFGYILQCFPGMDLRSNAAYYCLSGLNICLILVSIAFAALAAKKEKGNIAAFLVVLGSLAFLPYYLNTYKLYSDTLSMPFVSLSLWLTSLADHAEKKSLLFRFFAGIAVAVGVLLKGNLWILVIALCIYIAVKQSGWKSKAQGLICLLLGVIIVTQAWSFRSANLPWLDTSREDQYKLPAMHWIMMAAHGDGGYVQEDLDFSLSFETLEKRESAVKDRYIQRVKEHGPIGYLRFLHQKLALTFADGLFSQLSHLVVFTYRKIGVFASPYGSLFSVTTIYANTFLCLIYFAVLLSGLLHTKGHTGLELALNISLFGTILFFCLWEAKSRYLLNLTPMYLLLTSLTIVDLAEFFRKRCKKDSAKP